MSAAAAEKLRVEAVDRRAVLVNELNGAEARLAAATARLFEADKSLVETAERRNKCIVGYTTRRMEVLKPGTDPQQRTDKLVELEEWLVAVAGHEADLQRARSEQGTARTVLEAAIEAATDIRRRLESALPTLLRVDAPVIDDTVSP